jgi:hypothetical protein
LSSFALVGGEGKDEGEFRSSALIPSFSLEREKEYERRAEQQSSDMPIEEPAGQYGETLRHAGEYLFCALHFELLPMGMSHMARRLPGVERNPRRTPSLFERNQPGVIKIRTAEIE